MRDSCRLAVAGQPGGTGPALKRRKPGLAAGLPKSSVVAGTTKCIASFPQNHMTVNSKTLFSGSRKHVCGEPIASDRANHNREAR